MGRDRTVKGFRGREGGASEVAIAFLCTGQHSEQGECRLRLPVMNLCREHRENNVCAKCFGYWEFGMVMDCWEVRIQLFISAHCM